jgi:F-type H+-transporting ATPase subunit epsilon
MKLNVSTPLAVVVDSDDVTHLRAEDETGAFGILPGHADFLTVLAVSVVTWRDQRETEHYVAVRGGVFEVRGGDTIVIATKEAVHCDDLHHLETEVLVAFRRGLEEDRAARVDAQRLYLAAVRQICCFLRSDHTPAALGGLSARRYDQPAE